MKAVKFIPLMLMVVFSSAFSLQAADTLKSLDEKREELEGYVDGLTELFKKKGPSALDDDHRMYLEQVLAKMDATINSYANYISENRLDSENIKDALNNSLEVDKKLRYHSKPYSESLLLLMVRKRQLLLRQRWQSKKWKKKAKNWIQYGFLDLARGMQEMP